MDTFTQPPLVISWAKRYTDQRLILLLEDRTRENPYSDPARRLREFQSPRGPECILKGSHVWEVMSY